MEEYWIVAIGSPFSGLRLVGTFANADEATAWAEDNTKDTWWVLEVEALEDF